MYVDRDTARLVLTMQAKKIKSQLDMVASWDKRPKSDFTEEQGIALGNLCVLYDDLIKDYSKAIEAFK